MSRLLEMTGEVVINSDTGKRRIMTHLFRDEHIDIAFVLDANQAEQWAAKMQFLAGECRKPVPVQERISFPMQIKKKCLGLWRRANGG